MAKVHVSNVVVLNNPSPFYTPFQFEITFECIEELKEDLEWKIIYVGSAESEAYDQTLDSVFVGPVPEGRHMFVFQADPPDINKIPVADAVGVTVVLLTCSYRTKEFVRVGYYVNNEYSDPEMRENPPSTPDYNKLLRNILATQPRVTRFKIEWDDKPNTTLDGSGTENPTGESITDPDEQGSTMQIQANETPVPLPVGVPSNGSVSTNLMMNLNLSNGSGAFGETERFSADSASSLLEPPGPLISGTGPMVSADSSESTAMEVI